MKRSPSRTPRIQETLVVEDWAYKPTNVVLKSDAVLIELPDDFTTVFKEGTSSLELLGEGAEYFLKTQEGATPAISIGIRVFGRTLLVTLEQGSIPANLSVWIVMSSCSCHLVFNPGGGGYRKYILKRNY